VLVWSASAGAYPWMIKKGYGGCATCHADPSGGETLTPYGRAQGELQLRMQYVRAMARAPTEPPSDDFDSFDSFDDVDASTHPSEGQPDRSTAPPDDSAATPAEPGARAGFLWGLVSLPSDLMLGGSIRLASFMRPLLANPGPRWFPMQADVYGVWRIGAFEAGGSVGAARVPAGSEFARRAQITTNQGDQLNAISRTHWVGLRFQNEWWLRAGRLNLPFGVRIPEHVMWVRSETQTDRESDQQHGVAMAYSGQRVRGEVMLIAGNYQVNPDRYRERGYAGFAELEAADELGLGASSLLTYAEADVVTLDEQPTLRQAHGLFARWAASTQVVLLTEADVLLRSRRRAGYVAFAQSDYEPIQGLHLMLTGEALDAGQDRGATATAEPSRPGAGRPRFGGWLGVDWFAWSHIDLRVDGRYEQPQNAAMRDSSLSVLGQLHVYL